MIALSVVSINRKYIALALAIGLHIVIPSSAALAQSAVVCDRIGSRVVCKQKRTLLDDLNTFADRMSEQREARENKRQRDLENERIAEYQRREEQRLRLEIENAEIERRRVETLRQKQNIQFQEDNYAKQAEQDLRDRVSTAVLEGRCEDAKAIALLASRLDMAEQALRICKPQATKSPQVSARSKNLGGQVVPALNPIPAVQSRASPCQIAIRKNQACNSAAKQLDSAYKSSATTDKQREAMLRIVSQHTHGTTTDWPKVSREYFAWRANSGSSNTIIVEGTADIAATSQHSNASSTTSVDAAQAYMNGIDYLSKKGERQPNEVFAFEQLTKASSLGHLEAKVALGYMYLMGKGGAYPVSKALPLLLQAAEQGNAAALFNLGIMYKSGVGVAADTTRASRYFRRALDMGYEAARTELQ